MNKYKNITSEDLYIPNLGLVKAGEIVETEMSINNANFQKVVEPAKTATPVKEEDKNKIK